MFSWERKKEPSNVQNLDIMAKGANKKAEHNANYAKRASGGSKTTSWLKAISLLIKSMKFELLAKSKPEKPSKNWADNS